MYLGHLLGKGRTPQMNSSIWEDSDYSQYKPHNSTLPPILAEAALSPLSDEAVPI